VTAHLKQADVRSVLV